MVNKNVVITGGAGFIGSNLADCILDLGLNVIIIDNLCSGKIENINHNFDKPNFNFFNFDIIESSQLNELIQQADVIFHFAAKVGVMQSILYPIETIKNNIKASEIVIELCYKYNKKLIIASTSEVYGKNYQTPISEQTQLSIGSPEISRWAYAASKIIDEFLTMSYVAKGLNAVICRFFNIVGFRQSKDSGMVIPTFIQQALNNEPITIFGDGEQIRSFCDIRDLTKVLVGLIDYNASNYRIFNVGNPKKITINDLACLIKEITNSESIIKHIPVEELPYGFEEVPCRFPDISLISKELNCFPRYSIENTIEKLVQRK